MAYNIKIFKAAVNDFDDAVDWYAAQSAPTARKFGNAFQKIVRRLSDNPFQFPKVGDEAHKARLAKPFPYNVFYLVEEDTVYIVSVFHDSRDPKIWQERL